MGGRNSSGTFLQEHPSVRSEAPSLGPGLSPNTETWLGLQVQAGAGGPRSVSVSLGLC